MNHAGIMLNDVTNPEYKMFHSGDEPPISARVITALEPHELTIICLIRIADYLAEFIEPDDFIHHQTDTLIIADKEMVEMGEDIIIVRLDYEKAPPRTMSFRLSAETASLRLH